MIHEAKDTLVERGFEEVKQFEDSHGTIGYALTYRGENYILVAKEYAHNRLASFIAVLVRCYYEDADFIFYNNSEDLYYVFDGKYLEGHATPSSGPSKKRDCSWREIGLDHGAELDAFIRNEESPETLAGSNAELGVFT